MLATPPLDGRYERFRDALLRAVVDGQSPSSGCDLGDRTRSIIESIADEHPEASPTLIAEAYDAFDQEPESGSAASSDV